MPVALRTPKADAKFDVITEFPHLGLHWAASTGDLGLVTYALEHGQPVNSAVDGILPLHAAASGGNDHVVKLLIERGADVNAARLPRRYTNDKSRHRDAAPIVGSTGATPLHFAAANGHTDVVRTLLQRGAHAARPDKHGVTPEMLARGPHDACADLLAEWAFARDADLRERDGISAEPAYLSVSQDRQPSASGASEAESSGSSGLRKRLQVKRSMDKLFRGAAAPIGLPMAPELPPARPFGEYTFYSDPACGPQDFPTGRRPSLPHILEAEPPLKYRPCNSAGRGGSRRPRSAGNGADTSPAGSTASLATSTGRRKLSTKTSLLNMFRRGSDSAASETPASVSPPASPARGVPPPLLAGDAPGSLPWHRQRLESETGARPPLPSAVDVHRALSRETAGSVPGRTRSGSGASSTEGGGAQRPSILRGHGRSSSGGQKLRFDAAGNGSTTGTAAARRGLSPPKRVRASGSTTSLRRRSGVSPGREATLQVEPPHEDEYADIWEEEEEEYGSLLAPEADPAAAEGQLRKTLGRVHGRSQTGSTDSLSPALSPTVVTPHRTGGGDADDFPFSLREPPPPEGIATEEGADGLGRLAPPPRILGADDHRARGGSVSSASTSNSGGLTTPGPGARLPLPPQTSSHGSSPSLPGTPAGPTGTGSGGYFATDGGSATAAASFAEHRGQRSSSRARVAGLGIDLSKISSRAQAEALVQRAQQSILEMPLASSGTARRGSEREVAPEMGEAAPGAIPLSARLAAYGETLEIERRLKAEEEQKNARELVRTPPQSAGVSRKTQARDMDRTMSDGVMLQPAPAARRPRRPRTAEDKTETFNIVAHTHSVESSGRLYRSRSTLLDPHADLDDEDSSAFAIPSTPVRIYETSATPLHTPLAEPSPVFGGSRYGGAPSRSRTLAQPMQLTRSRTPDSPSEDEAHFIPLSRTSTAPSSSAYSCGVPPAPSPRERERERANKLARMGFNAKPSAAASAGSTPLYADMDRIAGGMGTPTKRGFSGIRSFVQSLKGK